MTYCVTLKHGEVERHESMVDALLDLAECMDNPPGHGATIWWEDPVPGQCVCRAPSSTLVAGRWICDECGRDTDVHADDDDLWPDEIDEDDGENPLPEPWPDPTVG